MQVHVLVQLALADLLAALILMANSAMNRTSASVCNEICPYSLPLSLTFYCISFLLVVVYAWQSNKAIQGWRARTTEDEGGQVIYYKVGKWYKRHEQEGLFPVEGDGRSRRRLKRMISTARNMVMVILFCWLPAVALIPILLSTLDVKQNILFVILVIQAATVSMQGFLNSMVYAWSRPNFTEAVLGEKTPLVAHDHQAFFDESLRTSAC
ncbi:hypothetical protein GBF38_020406 [Nibea albiflora]|uniref:Uncharacterized protein n=1 Tax=Nibea albiflora TaxID=240163 RepID=A0ACB7FHP1_NIBAL|nr:hypothetical protein GBF38_020406 [Nibea albiflora]